MRLFGNDLAQSASVATVTSNPGLRGSVPLGQIEHRTLNNGQCDFWGHLLKYYFNGPRSCPRCYRRLWLESLIKIPVFLGLAPPGLVIFRLYKRGP